MNSFILESLVLCQAKNEEKDKNLHLNKQLINTIM